MNKKAAIDALNGLLKPLGFARHGQRWNRHTGSAIDVLDIQTSKAADSITINLGILDVDVYRKLWGSEPPKFVDAPSCTVVTRVGALIDNKDKWWMIDDVGIAEDIVRVVTNFALPFLERMREREAIESWLTDTELERKHPYPMFVLNLAIIKDLLGKKAECCEILSAYKRKSVGNWQTKFIDLAKELGCP